MDLFAPIDVVADLEAEVGEPIVTRELLRLVDDTKPPPKLILEEHIPHEGAKVTIRNGEFQARALEALADGKVDNQELDDLIAIAEAKMREATDLHDKLWHLKSSRAQCARLDVVKAAE